MGSSYHNGNALILVMDVSLHILVGSLHSAGRQDLTANHATVLWSYLTFLLEALNMYLLDLNP